MDKQQQDIENHGELRHGGSCIPISVNLAGFVQYSSHNKMLCCVRSQMCESVSNADFKHLYITSFNAFVTMKQGVLQSAES